MKIGVVCPKSVPYVRGGAERLWDGLVQNIPLLTEHDAELVAIDSPEGNLREVVESYAMFDLLDVSRFDLVITSKYPAWMISHPRHIVYLMHPLRGLYDTYQGPLRVDDYGLSANGRRLNHLLDTVQPGADGGRQDVLEVALAMVHELDQDHPQLAFPGPLARHLVQWLDRDAFTESNTMRLAAISKTVARRPGYFPLERDVEVIYPPSNLDGLHPGTAKRQFFTASRLDAPKRIDLIIEAMRHVDDGDIELRIAGTGPQRDALQRLAQNDPRITLLGQLTDEALAEEYRSALAVPFVPEDEDLGMITLEAQRCATPVVTCTDSGGVTEFVDDGVTGLVVAPSGAAIGGALQRLASDMQLAAELGRRGEEGAGTITWDTTIGALLSDTESSDDTESGDDTVRRPRVVALCTYPAYPAHHGGQIRINRLLTALAKHVDVHLIALADRRTADVTISPGLTQSTVVRSIDCDNLDRRMVAQTQVPCGDIAAGLVPELGDFDAVARREIGRADAVILCQHYLYRYAADADCLILDAQNVEWRLKADVYRPGIVADELVSSIRELEMETIAAAKLVTAVSDQDKAGLMDLQPTLAEFVVVPNGGDVLGRPVIAVQQRAAQRDALLESLRKADVVAGCNRVAVFLGSAHPPNVEAAKLIAATAPLLPNVAFLLVGSHCKLLDGRPSAPNVFVRGVVEADELRHILSSCDVALNPVGSGSGTNLKMLDYFAAGAPTVATRIGARGLGAEADQHFLVAEADEQALEMAIRQVLADPIAADLRAQQARVLAEQFDWSVIGEAFADQVVQTIAEVAR